MQHSLFPDAKKTNSRGLIIIGTEGFNATICAKTKESFKKFKQEICNYFNTPDLFFKDSTSDVCPFRRFKVKIRDEIVTLGDTTLVPYGLDGVNHHLSPSQWNNVMKNEITVKISGTDISVVKK